VHPQPVTSSRVVVVTITKSQSMVPETTGGPEVRLAGAEGQPRPFPCEGSSIRRNLNPPVPRIRCYG